MNLWKSQAEHDGERRCFTVTFPTPLPPDQVQRFFRVVATTLPTALFDAVMPRPSVVLETWAEPGGFVFRLLVPWQLSDQITGELRHLVPGAIIVPDDTRPRPTWDDIVEVGISNTTRTIHAHDPETIATDILNGLSHAMVEGETALLQWVISPAGFTPEPHEASASTRHGLLSAIVGTPASKPELDDRRRKLEHERYVVVGRIAAHAGTPSRAQYLVNAVLKGLRTASGDASFTAYTAKTDMITGALTPWHFPAVLNAHELTAVSGFPLGSPTVPGLPRPGARHLYATQDVAASGLIYGTSNHPNQKGRTIAQDWAAPSHTYVGGRTGFGKSAMLANLAAQHMRRGHGVVIMDASNSNSPETLFNRVVEYVPRERLGDVIIMDIAADTDRPIGLNLLDQTNPRMVTDQLSKLMDTLYPDTRAGVWTPQLIYNGMYALIEYGQSTLTDLITLIRPGSDRLAWYRKVIRSVSNPNVRAFFTEWDGLKQEERVKRSQPLWDRLWQLNNRPEVHDILGQTHSSFQLRDVLAHNKILLINLAGLPDDTAALLGTLITRALWVEAQGLTPDKPNFVYLDELQQMTKIDIGLNDMLSRGRKHGFFLTMSTQYLKGPAISDATRLSIVNHAATKILLTSSHTEASFWLPEFGRRLVQESDITELRKYDGIARINGTENISEPVTFTALAPLPSAGTADHARLLSSQSYGRTLAQVEADIAARLMVKADEKPPPDLWRKKVG